MEQYLTILDYSNNKIHIRKINTRNVSEDGNIESIISIEDIVDRAFKQLSLNPDNCSYMTGFSLNVDINLDL